MKKRPDKIINTPFGKITITEKIIKVNNDGNRQTMTLGTKNPKEEDNAIELKRTYE